MEGLIKAGFAVVLLIALALGGIGGFTAVLASLVLLLGIVGVFGLAAFLVLRSRLINAKKISVVLILSAGFLGLVWKVITPPDHWPQMQATVTQLTSPTYLVMSTYRYEVARNPFDYQNQHEWKNLVEAQKNTPTTLALYYNPNNPAEASEKASTHWTRVPSALVGAVPKRNGNYQAQARVLVGFMIKAFTVRGDFLAKLKTGSTFAVWSNPLNPDEFSLEPRLTVGGKRYPLILFAFGLGLAGTGLILHRPKVWLTSRATVVAAEPPAAVNTKEALRQIDWYQFEKVTARLLECDGWSVQRRGGANPDGGADLIARREGKSVVVQCKHWKNWEIPPKVMRELLGTRVSAGFTADSAMLFTLNRCTADALRFATENSIEIFDAGKIASLIDVAGVTRFPELTHPDHKLCPKCDAPMVRRKSLRGSFWGCSRYGTDRCRGRIDILAVE